MNITMFDRKTAGLLHKEVVEAAQVVARKYGLTITRGSGSYSDTACVLKVDVALASTDGKPTGRFADAFRQLAVLYGFAEDDLDREIREWRQKYRISGINSRSDKYPVTAVRVGDQVTFKFPVAVVLKALGRKAHK